MNEHEKKAADKKQQALHNQYANLKKSSDAFEIVEGIVAKIKAVREDGVITTYFNDFGERDDYFDIVQGLRAAGYSCWFDEKIGRIVGGVVATKAYVPKCVEVFCNKDRIGCDHEKEVIR